MKFSRTIAIIFIACISLFTEVTVIGQNNDALSTEDLIGRAARRSQVYLETFKNLLSEEIKTFEIINKQGEVKKQRKVESTFLVYQLVKDDGQVAEFRNVVAVDGKKLGKTEERAKDFFEKVVSSESSQKELDRIRDESSRYDEDYAVNGLTLFQAIALNHDLRPSFTFTVKGTDTISGIKTIVIAFEQTGSNRSITVNGTGANNYDIEIDGEKSELNPRIRGKLWLDAETLNIRREVRERTIQPFGWDRSVVVSEDIFEYGDSEFGILTPKKIVHVQNVIKLKERSARKDAKVEFVYGRFTKPDVEVRSSEVKSDN